MGGGKGTLNVRSGTTVCGLGTEGPFSSVSITIIDGSSPPPRSSSPTPYLLLVEGTTGSRGDGRGAGGSGHPLSVP